MNTGRTRHLATTTATVVGLVVAVGAALVFARAEQVVRVADDAKRLGAVQTSIADTATHRASLVIAFAALDDGDVPAVSLQAAGEALAISSGLVERLGGLPESDSLGGMAENLEEATFQVRELLEAGSVDEARGVVENGALVAVADLVDALTQEAVAITGRIEGERQRAGQLAQAGSFLVALLVPALAVFIVRRSARRRLERERLESEVMRQKELSETKDQLIAGLSHQLRTPITGIYGWADLLLTRLDSTLATEAGESILSEAGEVILSEAGELARMVDDILVTARLHATNLGFRGAPGQVIEVIEQAVAHYERLGALIKIDCDPAHFSFDRARLHHVVVNLVSNALAHGAEPVEIIGRVAGNVYQIAICDYGSGLDHVRAAQPFAPFAHAPAEVTVRNSLGLGLSVVRALVDGMGGDVSYHRHQGRTVFAISLPSVTAPVSQLV